MSQPETYPVSQRQSNISASPLYSSSLAHSTCSASLHRPASQNNRRTSFTAHSPTSKSLAAAASSSVHAQAPPETSSTPMNTTLSGSSWNGVMHDGKGKGGSSSRTSNGHAIMPSFTRLAAGSPLNSSLSMPAIARKHAHADRMTSSPSDKRNSATLLVSSIETDRENAKRLNSNEDREPSPAPRSMTTDSTSSFSDFGDVNGSSESVASSLATSVSSGASMIGPGKAAGEKAIRALRENTTSNAEALSITTKQPPAPPSNADEAGNQSRMCKASSVAPPECPSNGLQEEAPKRDENVRGVPLDPNDCSQQQIPTIEQRDALAARVYDACRTAGYDEWLQLLDLAPLASQHHLSGYNCIKFGLDGSPYAYLPLTLQQPAQAHQVAERQKDNESAALQWLARKRKQMRKKKASAQADRDGDTQMNGVAAAKRCEACCEAGGEIFDKSKICECGPLRNEAVLRAEWETPIGTQEQHAQQQEDQRPQPHQQQPAAGLAVKTSDTHPISISPIIPPELLRDISEHIHHGIPSSIGSSVTSHAENHFDSDTTDDGHLRFQVDGKRLIRCRVTQIDMCEVAFKAEQELIDATHNQRKPRSLTLTSPQAPEPPPQIVHDALTSSTRSSPSSPFMVDRSVYCQTGYRDEVRQDVDGAPEAGHSSPSPSPSRDECVQVTQEHSPSTGRTVGNLLLSSCPGKKVRLTGPVRGRGAICRDLGLDLLRIAQMGVGAIVCCLDDEELQFLGAPWSQYEAEADKLNIEVIRLPMAEGFAPTDVLATDKAISCVVNDYTLRGTHVLVHCRGGVGRAGLIACMWMLKLGLIRSDRDEMCNRVPMASLANLHKQTNEVRRSEEAHKVHSNGDVMQTIHRVIETIRRRRSPKAIETAEQVCFLVKYLHFLHDQERKLLHQLASTLAHR